MELFATNDSRARQEWTARTPPTPPPPHTNPCAGRNNNDDNGSRNPPSGTRLLFLCMPLPPPPILLTTSPPQSLVTAVGDWGITIVGTPAQSRGSVPVAHPLPSSRRCRHSSRATWRIRRGGSAPPFSSPCPCPPPPLPPPPFRSVGSRARYHAPPPPPPQQPQLLLARPGYQLLLLSRLPHPVQEVAPITKLSPLTLPLIPPAATARSCTAKVSV